MIPVMIGVTLVVFLTMRVLPGDPVRVLLRDQGARPEQMQALRTELGLDAPLPVQYVRYLRDLLRGDLGQSFSMRQPALGIILSRIPATVELTLAALVMAVIAGLLIGTAAAMFRGTAVDYIATSLATTGLSIPSFWIGLMLILFFSASHQLLPSFGRIGDAVSLNRVSGFYILDSIITGNWAALVSTIRHLVLPSTALGIVLATYVTRIVRSSMVEVLQQDYMRTAVSKGVGRWKAALAHGLRNALLPLVTLLGVQLGNLLSGAIVIETVFAWPGLGRLVVDGIYQRDFPLVQGAVLLFALVRLLLNFATDLLYARIDPRISYG